MIIEHVDRKMINLLAIKQTTVKGVLDTDVQKRDKRGPRQCRMLPQTTCILRECHNNVPLGSATIHKQYRLVNSTAIHATQIPTLRMVDQADAAAFIMQPIHAWMFIRLFIKAHFVHNLNIHFLFKSMNWKSLHTKVLSTYICAVNSFNFLKTNQHC